MPARRKEIIETLRFVENNENISFTSRDDIRVDLDLLRKLMSADLVRYDVRVIGTGIEEYNNLQIRLDGILFLSELEKEEYKNSFLGKTMPQLEKLLWLIVGALIVFISQLVKANS